MPQKYRAHAANSCDTCPVFSWHVVRVFVVYATTFVGMCANFSGYVPQLFVACAVYFVAYTSNFVARASDFVACGILLTTPPLKESLVELLAQS